MVCDTDNGIDERQFRKLCDIVYRHCGINLHDGKQELVRARVARQLRTRPNITASAYIESVIGNPTGEEFASLIDALSTNLTSFFRESAHFTFLTDKLLPQTTERARRRGSNRIRAWSAACSTGEEPYSMAITLNQALAGKGHWDCRILATDISRNVLKTAINARYDVNRIRTVPESLQERYFATVYETDTDQPRVQVDQSIRQMVTFNYLNLMETWPFTGPFDFIFCRNVMIYFDKQTQERLVNRFHGVLESGGVLFTGHSESLTGINHKFDYVQPTIYRKA